MHTTIHAVLSAAANAAINTATYIQRFCLLAICCLLLAACSQPANDSTSHISAIDTPPAGYVIATGTSPLVYRFSDWKYNSRGAYSIIFDDYCFDEAFGIRTIADPEAAKRDLRFGFGVVTDFCDNTEWQAARRMISNGHEVINHSHTHRCGQYHAGWCEDVWGQDDFDVEIDGANTLIAEHTGHEPGFFIFPFDLSTPAMIDHLQAQQFIGSRTGEKQALNNANLPDHFRLNFDVQFPDDQKSLQGYSLNEYVDIAIKKGALAFREVHGVQDQSWGSTGRTELLDHFDYLQAKRDSGELWVETISPILHYSQAKKDCHLHTSQVDNKADADVTASNHSAQWLRIICPLYSNPKILPTGTELTVEFSGRNLQLKDASGTPVKTVNNSYTLTIGEHYQWYTE